jgi:hypothetical protein
MVPIDLDLIDLDDIIIIIDYLNDYLNLWSINNNNKSIKCINSIQINNNYIALNMTLNPIDSSHAILFTTTTAKNKHKQNEDALKKN